MRGRFLPGTEWRLDVADHSQKTFFRLRIIAEVFLKAQRFFSARDLARIFASVVTGVIASGSMARRTIAGLPEACASLNAAGKSAVRSTDTPKPPNARA